MEKIPTAEEFLIDKGYSGFAKHTLVKEWMKEFAKLHVEAALKEASEKAKITYEYSGNTGSEYCDEFVDKDSILNSYPSENIK
jgi:hypothetical protein